MIATSTNDSLPDGYLLRTTDVAELDALVQLDDAACVLYERAGMHFSFPSDHPFVQDEWTRWRRALGQGLGRAVVTSAGKLAAFAIFGEVDDEPYLDQLSVHPDHQRRGLGSFLIAECIRWAAGRDLWLTTYAHLPWNGPYYSRWGFSPVPEEQCGPQMRAVLRSQRAALPEPEKRIAMMRAVSVDP